ncbi:MAG: hydrogen peroxide-inducible genes activator [Gammaproteobacteria bacterium]|nr:hydrogen peroxide-inducible genes activator [Gammaproteobacteria bacterium]
MNALPSPRQLRYLVALSEKLNFGRAAEECFVTQSTLSAGIQELEELLGVRLVERDRRRVRLTAIGEDTVARAREILARCQDLVEIARSTRGPLSGELRLGVIPTIAPFLLPQVLPELRERHPCLKLYLREDLTDRLLGRLRAGQIDAALIALPYDTGDLTVSELFGEEFWYVTRTDDPRAGTKGITVDALDRAGVLLLEEGHCLREHAIAACGPRPPGSTAAVEATSLVTLVQMVEGGLGTTLLPEMTLKAGLLNGTHLVARPFAAQAPSRTIALAWRATSPRTRDFQLLCELITERRRRLTEPGLPSLRRRRTGAIA